MTRYCGKTSVLLLTATFLTLVAFLLLLLGFATPLWSSRSGCNEGLWQICTEGACGSVVDTPLGDQPWFISVHVLIILGFVLGFLALIVTFTVMFDVSCRKKLPLRFTAVVSEFASAALLLIGLVVYWVEGSVFFCDFSLNFSWGVTMVATIIFIVAGILLFVDIDQIYNSDEEKEFPVPDSVSTEQPAAGTD